jgi:hypothetical protein
MVEFLFEAILKIITSLLRTLVEVICVQTGRILLPIVSFGAFATHQNFAHPPAYGERRPIVVGSFISALFGIAFWTLATALIFALVR